MTSVGRRCLTVLATAVLLAVGALALPRTATATPASCPSDATAHVIGTKTVVLLVHGFSSSAKTWTSGNPSMTASLKALPGVYVPAGFDYSPVADRWVTHEDIGPALARVIKSYADASAVNGTGKLVLVGHSMGGLAIRCALAQSCGGVAGNDQRVGDVITLGTPNTGSFWQFQHSAVAQKAALGTLGAICLGLSFDQIRQNQGLNDVCTFLHHAADSEAAQAFQQGSPQLKALPPIPGGIPVHGIAGEATLGTEIFFYHDDPMEAGDLVVGADSAHAQAQNAPNAKVTIDCGNWYLQFVHPALEVWKSLAWLQSGTCWHSSETSNLQFIQAVTGLVSDYVSTHATPPCTTAAMRTARDSHGGQPLLEDAGPGFSGYFFDEATVQGCAGGYGLAQFNHSAGSCFSYFVFVPAGGAWRVVDGLPTCIRIDAPDSQAVFARADIVAAGLDPAALTAALQRYVKRPLIGESNTPGGAAGSPPAGAPSVVSFETPSHNIACEIAVFGEAYDGARCDIAQAAWTPPPKPASCQLGWGMAMQVTASGPGFMCVGDTANNDQQVPYGSVETNGVFRCDVENSGVTCTDTTTGHGFTVAKAAYHLF